MNENEKRTKLLETQDVKLALITLGVPTMGGMLVSAFYNIVDAFFVGRLGTLQTAAVSVIYPLTMVGTGVGMVVMVLISAGMLFFFNPLAAALSLPVFNRRSRQPDECCGQTVW